MDIFEEIVSLKGKNRACALATIVQATGSTPQCAGAKMLIRDDGSTVGTLGGGCIEENIRLLALLAIVDRSTKTVPFDLTESESGLVCGGQIIVFVEPVLPDPHLIIIGAGHVGKALATAARFSGFRITVIDDRRIYAANVSDANEIIVNDLSDPLRNVAVGFDTGIVVATRGHVNDLVSLKAALRTPASYIGLVGSRRKREVIFSSLIDAGFSKEDAERVIVPVGIPIGSVTPEEIAISIMAQVISFRRNYGTNICNPPRSRAVETDGALQVAPSAR